MSGTAYAIPASAIVQVTPSVLAAGGTALDLLGLVLTTSHRVPVGDVLSFVNRTDVEGLFGLSSEEAHLAAAYFLAFDNSAKKPAKILFAQYNETAVNAWTRGASLADMTLAQLQAIPAGTFSIEIDGTPTTSGNVALAAATSFSNAGEILSTALGTQGPQTAAFTGNIAGTTLTVTLMAAGGHIEIGDEIRGAGVTAGTHVVAQTAGAAGSNGTYEVDTTQTVGPLPMTAHTPAVHYDSVTRSFRTSSGTVGPTSSIDAPTGPIAVALRMTSAAGAIVSQGAAAASPGPFMDGIIAFTRGWASFMTAFDPDRIAAGNTLKQEFAEWTNVTEDNYVYVAWDTDPTPGQTSNATTSLGNILNASKSSGTVPIYSPLQGPTVAAFMMGSIAAVDFTQLNGRKTMAFRQQTGMRPDVVSGSIADNLEANGYNYYGNWATANDEFTFLYPGQITGPFKWIDSYINQIWLNNQLQLALIELLVNAGSIPYNDAGYTMIKAAVMDVINQAIDFGAIRLGVTLSQAQIAEVNASAGIQIDRLIYTNGFYLQVRDATPQVRAARGSPPCSLWYSDGGSVQRLNLASVMIQ